MGSPPGADPDRVVAEEEAGGVDAKEYDGEGLVIADAASREVAPRHQHPAARRLSDLVRHLPSVRGLSVRRSVLSMTTIVVVLAIGQMVLHLQAIAASAYLLRRAEISYRQLGAYQQLAITTLEYLTLGPGGAIERRTAIDQELSTIDVLNAAEIALVRDNGGNETDLVERNRLIKVGALIQGLFVAEESTDRGEARAAATYAQAIKPLMTEAIAGERNEIAEVERAMATLQARMRWLGPAGAAVQILAVTLILLLVRHVVLKPIARLVSDIREFGRDRLGHRVDVPRHDEFGLLGQHINRMARHLERGRRALLTSNERLEVKVAARTRALKAKNDELRDVDESRRRFFADVSHELRTPLTAIVGEADVTLRASGSEIETCRDALASILANGTYLNRRIDDLMALARSSDGKLELETGPIDLNLVAAEAISQIRSLAKINRVITKLEPLEAPVFVDGDRFRLRQCLMILLDNAVKFSPAHTTVELRLSDEGGRARLTVSDHGRGIAIDELPRVFERFYQTEVGRRMGGTGLGLAIARRIIDAHDGTIVAERNGATGTAVTLTLPLLQDQDA